MTEHGIVVGAARAGPSTSQTAHLQLPGFYFYFFFYPQRSLVFTENG